MSERALFIALGFAISACTKQPVEMMAAHADAGAGASRDARTEMRDGDVPERDSGAAIDAGVAANDAAEPQLAPGFPVQVHQDTSTFAGLPATSFVSVGQLDDDPELELLISASNGPLWAWNHDGTPLEGWPESEGRASGHPAIGNLSGGGDVSEVIVGYGIFIASCEPDRFLLNGAGTLLSGWPVSGCNAGTVLPAALADLDADGVDEIFFGRAAYRANGTALRGWPADFSPPPDTAIADLDGDGELDLIFSFEDRIDAVDRSGMSLAGFPVPTASPGYRAQSVVVGDVDGDGAQEIVRPRKGRETRVVYVEIYDAHGTLKRRLETAGDVPSSTSLALADLDADGVPEIIAQTNGAIDAWHGDGSVLSGWPVHWDSTGDIGNSSPVIGDVDGDQSPDVVVVSMPGFVRAFHASGASLDGFPLALALGQGMVPAIADLDLDGRNEIIVGGDDWDHQHPGMNDALWVFDLGGSPHGQIEWGQLGGDARHRSAYPVSR